VAVNGPNLGFTWKQSGIPLTNNGANGFTGSFFTMATTGGTGTMTISNMQASLSGLTFSVEVTNSISLAPAIAVFSMPTLFPTPAIWTADFNDTNAYNTVPNVFVGRGAIAPGNIWNSISNTAVGGYYHSASSSNDVGSLTNTGVTVAIQGTGANTSGTGNYMFDVWEGLTGVYQPNGVVINTQPGFYNLFLYSMIGNYDNRGVNFTIHGFVQGVTNVTGTQGGGNVGPANGGNYSYVDNNTSATGNFIIFTNVFITNGVLNIGVNTNQALSTDDMNAIQLQQIAPYQDILLQPTDTTGTNFAVSWACGTLIASPTVNGPYTNVPNPTWVSNSIYGFTNYYQLPGTSSSGALFYRMMITNPVPLLPIQ
jgi:hypothetical protein